MIMDSLFSFRTAFFPVRNLRTQSAEQIWEIIVAIAAPLTPIWNTKIKTGSRIKFITAPMRTVSIPMLPNPWQLIKGFRPREIITAGVPAR